MTPYRFFSTSSPTISWIWVSNPTSAESSEARSASPVSVGAYTSWPAASKKGMTFCQHQPPNQPPCTSTNVAMLASFLTGTLIVIAGAPDFSSRDQATPVYSAGHRDTASLWRALPAPLDRPARRGSESTRCCQMGRAHDHPGSLYKYTFLEKKVER